ncbi:hypothetical protein, partial [Bradyrhizobium sp. CCBAU 11386]|uniref:hypothetical protein n=1 Tax=Bradyrhizobium sp. CCBAU 11386 TaxID=1630837 RepID=UPI0023028D5F
MSTPSSKQASSTGEVSLPRNVAGRVGHNAQCPLFLKVRQTMYGHAGMLRIATVCLKLGVERTWLANWTLNNNAAPVTEE